MSVRVLPPIVVLLLIALGAGCQEQPRALAQSPASSPAGATSPVVKVTVVKPERKTIRRTVEQPAQLEAFETTPLYANAAGYVQKVAVDMGDLIRGPRYDAQDKLVSRGQPLVELALPEVEDEVRQKVAVVAERHAEVAQAAAAVRVAETGIVTAQAQVTLAGATTKRTSANYEKWKSEHGRMVELSEKSAVNAKLVDETRNQLASADAAREETSAQLESAQASLAESQANLEKARADLIAAKARVGVAEADRDRSQARLDYGTIRAPFDGVITRRNVHTGHLIEPGVHGEPLLIAMRTDIMRVFLDVPELDAALVEPGDVATIRIPAQAGNTLTGKVTRVSWSLDQTARTLIAEVDVTNRDGKLRPGLYAYASILAAEHENALVLPASAVGSDKGASFCLVVDGGKIVRQPVTVGLRSGAEVEITGLQGDESIVRSNLTAYLPGQAVEPVPYVAPKP